MKKFILIRNKTFGNVYWTKNSISKTDDLEILFESDDVEEMIPEWEKYNYIQL